MGVDSNIEPKAVFPLRFWCQRVLPAVYDDSLSYYEAVCKMGSKLNEIIAIVNDSDSTLADMQDAIKELQEDSTLGRYPSLVPSLNNHQHPTSHQKPLVLFYEYLHLKR